MGHFSSFVILASMRTGSNFLEESLNAIAGVRCHGEAFNPVFIGHPKDESLLGLTLTERDRDPERLLQLIATAPGLNGFRFFPDHDPRVLPAVLGDPRCAKIILSRNPAESYVSLAIARATGQWKLGDVRRRRSARVRFDEAQFLGHIDQLATFRTEVQRALQTTGQTAFHLDYSDLNDPEIFSGLLNFLGVPAEGAAPSRAIVPQNPEPLADKVTNPREMSQALARIDTFALSRLPNFEPRRGPQVPAFIAARAAPLLLMPVASGPTATVRAWFDAMGGVAGDFTQTTLRDWMRTHPAHRRFTVLRHPVVRAFDAFERFLAGEPGPDICRAIARTHKITTEVSPEAFEAFLRFLKANLNAQTPHRTSPHWASQSATLQGFQSFASPDLVAREDSLAEDLAPLCHRMGIEPPHITPDPICGRLGAIRTAEHDRLAAQAYQRDYLAFGFSA